MVSALGVIGTAVLFALVLTLLLGAIDITHRVRRDHSPDASPWAYAVAQLVPYFLFLAGINVLATALVPAVVPEKVETEFLDPSPTWVRPLVYAFLGVFGFRWILSNLSYNALGKNLSIGEWVAKARDSAVAAVVRKQVRVGNERHQRRAQGLRELPEEELNAHISQLLGADVVAELEEKASENNTDSKLYKALHLAEERPDDVDAILKTARKPAGEPP